MPEFNDSKTSSYFNSRNHLSELLDLCKENLTDSQISNISEIIDTSSSPEELEQLQSFLERKVQNMMSKEWSSIDGTVITNDTKKKEGIYSYNKLKSNNLNLTRYTRSLKLEISGLERKLQTAQEELINQQKNENSYNEKIASLEKTNKDLSSLIQQEKIDKEIPKYVENVKIDLDNDDKHFINMSLSWSLVGIIFGIGAVVSAFYTLYLTIDFKVLDKIQLIYVFTRGIIGIAILSWLSHLGFSNSKRYTHESIMRKDRRHALMFGQVFLQIYGSTATKEDAIIVFKDWNMSGKSAFSEPMDQPPGLSTWIEIAKNKISSASKETETEKV